MSVNDLDRVRNPAITSRQQSAFIHVVAQLKSESPKAIKDTVLRRALAKYPKLLAVYEQHAAEFDISNQERWAIFSGERGVCQHEGCGNYTSWKRPAYRPYCCRVCAGLATDAARKATCKERYGVEHITQVPEVAQKMSASLRKTHAANGHGVKRKGRYEYVAPKVRPNTGNAFYAYVLLDPRKPGLYKYGRFTFDHEPFYVGKGKGGRAFSHVRTFDLEKIANPRKKNKIRSILRAELEPIVKIQKTELSELEAFELEARLIKFIGCGYDGPLTNQQRAVDGRAGYKHTKQTRHLLSEISKATWAAHQKDEYAARCCAISSAKAGYTLSEYRALLKTLPYGTVRIVIDAENFRMSRRAEHQCRCGHSWSVSPNYTVLQNVGCPACKAYDCNALSEKTKKIVAAKARTSYPAYIEYLKSEYGTEITVLADPSTFRMNYEQLHQCCHGHEWKISPKLLKRYRNGCPYCMTHTKRTAKQVLLNIGHI